MFLDSPGSRKLDLPSCYVVPSNHNCGVGHPHVGLAILAMGRLSCCFGHEMPLSALKLPSGGKLTDKVTGITQYYRLLLCCPLHSLIMMAQSLLQTIKTAALITGLP